MAPVVRIAMWSGPRTISTALMRAWENRADTVVVDEPLYGHYLATTGVDHPGRERVIAAQGPEWRDAVAALTAPLPEGIAVQYQKHMAHHLLPDVGRDWLASATHAFLIRNPREMLASLAKVTPNPSLSDTGLPQQVEIHEAVAGRQGVPPVIDARDVLDDPEGVLRALCAAVGVPFSRRMLSWPAGARATDGVWSAWWYDAVRASTGFAPYRTPAEDLPPALVPLLERCLPYYERLHRNRITG